MVDDGRDDDVGDDNIEDGVATGQTTASPA
jgi:hypothetical protein